MIFLTYRAETNINTFTWYLLNFYHSPFSYMWLKTYLSVYQWQESIFEMNWTQLLRSYIFGRGWHVSHEWLSLASLPLSEWMKPYCITLLWLHQFWHMLSTWPSGSLWGPLVCTVWTCVGECERICLGPHLCVDFRLTESQAYAQDKASLSPRHIFCD